MNRPHRPRVLTLADLEVAREEVARIGVREPALNWLAAKTQLRAVRLEKVRGKTAALLKQECLSVGCDCAVSPAVAAFDDTPRAVIIMATLRQYERLLEQLKRQVLGLADLAAEVEQALASYEAARAPVWTCRGRQLPVGQRTLIMGVLNLTPDSFSGDGLAGRPQEALARAQAMIAAGADILDIGGESTRPGSDAVPANEEWARVAPIIEALAGRDDVVLSLDTRKTEVAEKGLEAGVHIINDVGGLRAPGMAQVVAASGAGAIIMHMKGEPKTMQVEPIYEDLMTEIYEFLSERMEAALEAGVTETAIAVDPGFGFGKTVEHNLTIVRRLRELHTLGRPVVLGPSRKSTIGKVLDKPPEERVWGTAATCAVGIAAGAHVLRVHDVDEMRQVAQMTDAVLRGWQPHE